MNLHELEDRLDWEENQDRWRNRPPYPRWKLALDLAVLMCAIGIVVWILYCSM